MYINGMNLVFLDPDNPHHKFVKTCRASGKKCQITHLTKKYIRSGMQLSNLCFAQPGGAVERKLEAKERKLSALYLTFKIYAT